MPPGARRECVLRMPARPPENLRSMPAQDQRRDQGRLQAEKLGTAGPGMAPAIPRDSLHIYMTRFLRQFSHFRGCTGTFGRYGRRRRESYSLSNRQRHAIESGMCHDARVAAARSRIGRGGSSGSFADRTKPGGVAGGQ